MVLVFAVEHRSRLLHFDNNFVQPVAYILLGIIIVFQFGLKHFRTLFNAIQPKIDIFMVENKLLKLGSGIIYMVV